MVSASSLIFWSPTWFPTVLLMTDRLLISQIATAVGQGNVFGWSLTNIRKLSRF